MKCSSCAEVIRPVVVVDIDGTLADYHNHFVHFAEEYSGQILPLVYGGGQEFSEYLQLEKSFYREMKMAYRQGGMKRSMPIFFGADEFMWEVKGLDVEIWIATTRPWQRLDNIDPDTRHWLKRYHIPYDYMIYGDQKYSELLQRVDNNRILAVVEDQLEQCELANSALGDSGVGGRVWQPERSHNRNEQWENYFETFDQMLSVIKARLRWWDDISMYGRTREERHAT